MKNIFKSTNTIVNKKPILKLSTLALAGLLVISDGCKSTNDPSPEPAKSTYVTVYDKSTCKKITILESDYNANINNYSKEACVVTPAPSVTDSRNQITIGDGKIDTIKIAVLTPDFIDEKIDDNLLRKILDDTKTTEERKQYIGVKNPDGTYKTEDIIKFVLDKDVLGKGTYTRQDMDYIKGLVSNGYKDGSYVSYVGPTVHSDDIYKKALSAKTTINESLVKNKSKSLRGVVIITSSDLAKVFGKYGSKFGRSGMNGFSVVGPGPEFGEPVATDNIGEYSSRGVIGHEVFGHGSTGVSIHATQNVNFKLPNDAKYGNYSGAYVNTGLDQGGSGILGATEQGYKANVFFPSSGEVLNLGTFTDDGGLPSMTTRRSNIQKVLQFGPWTSNPSGREATKEEKISEACFVDHNNNDK